MASKLSKSAGDDPPNKTTDLTDSNHKKMAKPGIPKKKRGLFSISHIRNRNPSRPPSVANSREFSGPSIHSRAARRATSPSIDTDKSIKEATPPREREVVQPSVLAARHAAGVTKKTKRKAEPSSRARRKHEKGVDRAEAVSERTSKKVERSVRQGKAIRGRRKTWEEVNSALKLGTASKGVASSGANAFAALGGDDGDESEEEMEVEEVKEEAPLKAVVPPMVFEGGMEEDEEIL